MTVPELRTTLPQTITLPVVQERSTANHIEQYRRLAATIAPREESTNLTQRSAISAPRQVTASTPRDESRSPPEAESSSVPEEVASTPEESW